MKGIRRALLATVSLIAAVTMSACGGGGGGGGTTATPGPAVSKGVVTALGSVVVNGVTFSTTAATVKIDDNPSAADQLKVGMVVKVRGSSDDAAKTGAATLIEANDALEGTISAVDAPNKTITVMGQTVRIEDNVTRLNDNDTVKTFNDASFQVGNIVEVHGFADDNGGLRATRVAKKSTGEFEIKGFVVNTGATFGLSLTPGGASVLTVTGTLPAGAVVGSLVEVKSNVAPAGGAITATSVQLEDALGAAGEKVEVEGIVASGNVDSFTVNGQQVITSSATVFEGGLKTDFTTGIKVEAEGPLNASGVIVATKVSFRSSIKIEADVTAFSAGSSLTVLGKPVAINAFTRIDGTLTGVGNHVEVRAFPDRNNNLIATRIVVRSPDTRAFLQGPVTVTNGSMSILGISIVTSAGTEFRVSFDSSEAAVTSSAFFAQLKSGVTIVKVRWRPFSSTSLAVEQAEIQTGKSLSSSGDSSSKGVVTAKGSVVVNGITFHTGGAAVMIDGVPAAEDNLKVGMVVKVRGTVDDATQTGTATLVEANDALEGTVSALGANTLTVMGQTVQIEDNVTRLNDDNTVKTFAAANFAVGDKVEVHGFIDDNGGLRATRVAKKTEAELEVKGFVVSIGSGSFGLSLTPGGAATLTVTGSLPAGAVVGSIVEVKASAAPVGGAVTATLVKLEDSIGVKGEKVEVEGIVMSGGTVDSFTINGQKVITNASTLFEGGLKADFTTGIKVEAEGPLDANGAIVATKVSFRSNIKIEADVTAFTSGSSLTVLSKPVAINAFTRIDGNLTGVGNHVEVRAFLDRDNKLIATRVVAKSADVRAFLQGPVSAKDSTAGTMTILGVPITTNASTEFRVSVDSTDTAVLKDPFFTNVTTNVTVVKVRWATANTTAAVEQAEIQLGK